MSESANTNKSSEDDQQIDPKIVEEQDIIYDIDKILDVRVDQNGERSYKAQWVAYSWIPEASLQSFPQFLKAFWYSRIGINFLEKTHQKDLNQLILPDVALVRDTTVQEPSLVGDITNQELSSFIQETNIAKDNQDCNDNMVCSKCNQQFYLKSNLEVHSLYCSNKDGPSAVTPPQDNTLHNAEVQQMFEYIPNNIDNSTECQVCVSTNHLLIRSSVNEIAQFLCNSRKRIISNNTEVYECESCRRDFLFKHVSNINTDVSMSTSLCKVEQKKVNFNCKPFKCSICLRGFDSETLMLQHELKHSSTLSRYTCASCNTKFVSRLLLEQHYNVDSETCHRNKCDICNQVFVHASHLKRHLTLHAGLKPHMCKKCHRRFNQRSDLLRHETLHGSNDKVSCCKCLFSCETITELQYHNNSAHSQESTLNEGFKCDKCSKTFGRKSHYKRHQSIHQGIKPYHCDQCGKSFNQRTDLKRHQASHLKKQMKLMACGNQKDKILKANVFKVCGKELLLQHIETHQKI